MITKEVVIIVINRMAFAGGTPTLLDETTVEASTTSHIAPCTLQRPPELTIAKWIRDDTSA